MSATRCTARRVGPAGGPAGRARRRFAAGSWPSISIVLAARNEAARLPARIANLLDLPYPGRREIIVVSDGSTDETARGARRLLSARRHPRCIEVPGRRQAAGAQRRRRRGDRRHPRLRRRAAAVRARRADGAGRELRRSGGRRRHRRAGARLRVRRHRPRAIGDGVGALLEVREVAAPQRERGLVDARRDRRDLRAAPIAAGSRCPPTRCSTTCWRRCGRC